MAFKLIAAQMLVGQIDGSTQILPGTIPAGALVAGIIVAGIVNGTTIQGATLIADPGAVGEGVLAYNSHPPAKNQLLATMVPSAGSDSFGDKLLQGVAVYGNKQAMRVEQDGAAWYTSATDQTSGWNVEASLSYDNAGAGGRGMELSLLSAATPTFIVAVAQMILSAAGSSAVTAALLDLQGDLGLTDQGIPATPTGASRLFSRLGHVRTKSSDGVSYSTEHIGAISSNTAASPQLINSVGFSNVAALGGIGVGVGTYLIVGWVRWVGNQAAGAPEFQIVTSAGAAVSDSQIGFFDFSGTATNEAMTTVGSPHTGPTLRNGSGDMALIFGYAVVSTAGNLILQAAASIAADTYNITGAWLLYVPIT